MDFKKDYVKLNDDSNLSLWKKSMVRDIPFLGQCIATFTDKEQAKKFIQDNQATILTLLANGAGIEHVRMARHLSDAELLYHVFNVHKAYRCTGITFDIVIKVLATLDVATNVYFARVTDYYIMAIPKPVVGPDAWHLVHSLVSWWASAKVSAHTIATVIRKFTDHVRPASREDVVNTVKIFDLYSERFIMLCTILTFSDFMGWKSKARAALLTLFKNTPSIMEAADDVIEQSRSANGRANLPFDLVEYELNRGSPVSSSSSSSSSIANDDDDPCMSAQAPGGPPPSKKPKPEVKDDTPTINTWMRYSTFTALVKEGKRTHLIEVYRVVDQKLQPEQDAAVALALRYALPAKIKKLEAAAKPWPFAPRTVQGHCTLIWPDTVRDTEFAFMVEGALICVDDVRVMSAPSSESTRPAFDRIDDVD